MNNTMTASPAEGGGCGEGGWRGRILFLFLDGVGLAPAGPANPLSSAPMPNLRRLIGGPLVLEGVERNGNSPAVTLRALDACLGVPGLPQSATGQTALFTGVNAPALMGEHITAHPTAALREVIAEHSLLKQASKAGARAVFANAHSEHFWKMVREGKRRLGASTLTALAAGIPIPTLADLLQGRAVLWDITHEIASRYLDYDLPLVSAEEAGARLGRLAGDYEMVLFETFLPDLAGHGHIEAGWVLDRLDGFLAGILAHCPADTTLVVCSDHGNLEDSTSRLHTTNPVPLLAAGPAAACFQGATAITDVAPAILSSLGIVGPGHGSPPAMARGGMDASLLAG